MSKRGWVFSRQRGISIRSLKSCQWANRKKNHKAENNIIGHPIPWRIAVNIKKYMKAHESVIMDRLRQEGDPQLWNDLLIKHTRMIQYMQHERLIHLMVTIAFGLFLLVTMLIAFINPAIPVIILMGLFFILLLPYIIHYYFLENTIQNWYRLTDEIERKQITFR
jgi:Flp pilus assembly protein TadB